MREKHLRSIMKSLTWRFSATTVTIIASYIITGKLILALEIGLVEFLTKIAVYYLHERIWNSVKFGAESSVSNK